jgi:hypothetical protein
MGPPLQENCRLIATWYWYEARGQGRLSFQGLGREFLPDPPQAVPHFLGGDLVQGQAGAPMVRSLQADFSLQFRLIP